MKLNNRLYKPTLTLFDLQSGITAHSGYDYCKVIDTSKDVHPTITVEICINNDKKTVKQFLMVFDQNFTHFSHHNKTSLDDWIDCLTGEQILSAIIHLHKATYL